MENHPSSQILQEWPEESREAAQLVVDKYGEPDEATATLLVWHQAGEWKRIIASKVFYQHDFPAPHNDSVESVLDYQVPAEHFTALARFDGSVIVERTAGEVSARCHDEEANRLALNLMNDIVTGQKDVEEARAYYAKEFAGYRKKDPTPYMDKLQFQSGSGTADPGATRFNFALPPSASLLSKLRIYVLGISGCSSPPGVLSMSALG